MGKKLSFLLLFFMGFTNLIAQTGQVKRALDNLNEGNFEKAKELLQKAIEKDSLDPSVHYGWSRLFNEPSFPNTNLDSAYFFILKAKKSLKVLNVKEREKLSRNGIDSLMLDTQKNLLDSLSFERASNLNTVKSYSEFIINHPSSRQFSKAVRQREIVAYGLTLEENTYEAYSRFIHDYPDAEEIADAKKRYDSLRFQSVSTDGTLEGYYKFLEDQPGTLYRDQVESKIFAISTAGNKTSDFLTFFEFSRSEMILNKSKEYLFHILKEDSTTQWENQKWLTDSLKNDLEKERKKLIPIIEKQGYNFINEDGKTVFPNYFTQLSDQYLCEPLNSDVMLFFENNEGIVARRSGKPIYKGPVTFIDDLGYGIIKLESENKVGALHKTGDLVLNFLYDDIEVINGQFIGSLFKGKWGLHSFAGIDILPHEYDSIGFYYNSILLLKNQRWAVTTANELKKAANSENPNLVFIYDDLETLSDGKLWVQTGTSEGIINKDSGFDISLDIQNIEPLKNGYLVKKGGKSSFLDMQFNTLLDDCSNITQSLDYMSARSDGKYYLINLKTDKLVVYDSVKLWGGSYAVVSNADSLFLVPSDSGKITLSPDQTFRLIKNTGGMEYIQIINEKNSLLINKRGKTVLSGKYDEIYVLGAELILTEKKGKKGLYSVQGTKLLPEEYESIGMNSDGTVSLLRKGKLGFYDPKSQLLVNPEYDRKVEKGILDQIIVFKNGSYQLLTQKLKKLNDRLFEEIKIWNDSSYLVKWDGFYHIYIPVKDYFKVSGMSEVKFLFSEKGISYFKTKSKKGEGLISPQLGTLIEPEFSYISYRSPFLVAEKYISSASYYVLIYFDTHGKVLWKGGIDEEDYDKMFCND